MNGDLQTQWSARSTRRRRLALFRQSLIILFLNYISFIFIALRNLEEIPIDTNTKTLNNRS